MAQTIILLNEYIDQGYSLPAVLDDATKSLVVDWFGDRALVKETFDKYFERSCNAHYPYYKQMLRIDPTISQYDWFVDNYLERQTTGKDSSTATTTGTNSRTGSSTNESTTEGSGTNSSTTDSSNTNSNTNHVQDITAGATAADHQERSQPMSSSYTALQGDSTMSAGTLVINDLTSGMAAPDILNPSGSAQDRNRSTGAEDSTTTDSGSDTGHSTTSGSHSDKSTTSGSGTTNESETVNNTVSNDRDNTTQEIATGRNEDLPTLIDKARATISRSMAWFWLYHELDKCFLCVFDDYDTED